MITGMRNKQRGAELVEFAITAMLLFLLLFGTIEFSVALFDKATITNAGREGARTGILFRPEPRNLDTEDTIIRERIEAYAEDYLISLGGPAEMEIDIQRTLSAVGTFGVGEELTVTVTYPYQFLIVPGFIAGMGGGINLSSTTVMRAE
ncbi:TadE/TadG family type IV pilus assembly protein [Aquisalimonas sp.]|uniref:TadE family protein n=1 Tax=Aquisalimonas sp. TaxID=1872621 RepID=UPI0025C16EA0|nr:TadE/TadG family type IV pilus assembly protein [Aquisalimonas sp.]